MTRRFGRLTRVPVSVIKEEPKPVKEKNVPAKKEEPVGFKVYVKSRFLNIRKAPGMKSEITGAFTGVGAFDIVEEKDGWGRLKDGRGWISLDHAERL